MENENTPTPEETLPGFTPEDGFTPEEVEIFRTLNARYKALRRKKIAEEKFNKKVDENRDSILKRWNLTPELSGQFWNQIKAAYSGHGHNFSDQTLLKFLTREKLVRSFNDRLEASSHVEGENELVESEIDAESRS